MIITHAEGAAAGFLIWFGFVAPTGLTNKLFANRLTTRVLEAGNHLLVLVLFGAVLGAWRRASRGGNIRP